MAMERVRLARRHLDANELQELRFGQACAREPFVRTPRKHFDLGFRARDESKAVLAAHR
jgi:hypothetical protein